MPAADHHHPQSTKQTSPFASGNGNASILMPLILSPSMNTEPSLIQIGFSRPLTSGLDQIHSLSSLLPFFEKAPKYFCVTPMYTRLKTGEGMGPFATRPVVPA